MIRNALITSYRTIVNNKTYTIINVTGLVLGLTAAFVLLVFAINETSFNTCFTKKDRLYRAVFTDSKGLSTTGGSRLFKSLLPCNIPECKKVVRMVSEQQLSLKMKVDAGNKLYDCKNFVYADTEIFNMLDLRFVRGGIQPGSLKQNSLFMSESAVKKIYNGEVRLFQKVSLMAGKNRYEMILAGIYTDLPWNSTINTDFIAGLPFYETILKDNMPELVAGYNSWDDFLVETLCEFSPGTEIRSIIPVIQEVLNNNVKKDVNVKISFQSFGDIYFESGDFANNSNLTGNKLAVYTYSWLAFFILLLAGINYAILSTARSALRFKEVGVRKVLGATKRELRIQILIESVLLTFMALPLALFLLGLIDPRITGLPDYTITMHASNMLKYILFFAGITLVIGILSGLYVAVYLAGLNPVNALKARYFTPGKFNLSKLFIGFQLFITLSLLICMLTIYSQIRMCYVSNLSISRQNILLVPLKNHDFKKYSAIKSKLAGIPDIISFSGSGLFSLPSKDFNVLPFHLPNSQEPVHIECVNVDRDFFKTLGIPLIRGRDFDTSSMERGDIECIINEEGAKTLKYKNPLGVNIDQTKIVGVSRDFNFHNLHYKINATRFLYNPFAISTLIIHYKQGRESFVVEEIKKAWEAVYPKSPFDHSFFRQELRDAYTKENNFVTAVAVFTILAFIITGMGLFGLALLISERKTKETAIRKVFGASNVQIIFRMQREFLLYTAIAAIVAIPVSWLLMQLWLKEFYYRVNISPLIMIMCVLAVTTFVSVILLMRTLKVLRSNPINALKYE